MAGEHWLRWHHGTVTDPKWRVVASRCVTGVTVGHVVTIWAAMVENASLSSPRGTLQGWDDEDVAALFGYTKEQVSDIRRAMQGKTLDGDKLTGWEKRQPNREDSSTERTREYRKRKAEKSDAQKRDVTQRDATTREVTLEERREEKKDQKPLDHRADDRACSDTFETKFWPAYPRKVGKATAAKAFAKLRPDGDTVKRMLVALAQQRTSEQWQRDGGQFVPHAATWLNGRRWEDEFVEATRSGDSAMGDILARAV